MSALSRHVPFASTCTSDYFPGLLWVAPEAHSRNSPEGDKHLWGKRLGTQLANLPLAHLLSSPGWFWCVWRRKEWEPQEGSRLCTKPGQQQRQLPHAHQFARLKPERGVQTWWVPTSSCSSPLPSAFLACLLWNKCFYKLSGQSWEIFSVMRNSLIWISETIPRLSTLPYFFSSFSVCQVRWETWTENSISLEKFFLKIS